MTSPSKTQDGLVAPKNRPKGAIGSASRANRHQHLQLHPSQEPQRRARPSTRAAPLLDAESVSNLLLMSHPHVLRANTRLDATKAGHPLRCTGSSLPSLLTRPLCHRCRGGTSPSPRLCSPAHTNARGAGEGAGPKAPNAFRTSASSPGRPVTLRPGPYTCQKVR